MAQNQEPKTPTRSIEAAHGLTASEIESLHDKFNKFMPSIVSASASGASDRRRSLFTEDLPKGAAWDPIRKGQLNNGVPYMPGTNNGVMNTNQMPYQPEFASLDRQQYPVHRILANRYWRLFNKLDPVIGNCIEMYSQLPWSNFELTGDGVEGEIRQMYEQQCRETAVLAMLPNFVSEFLVVGEAIIHTNFDNSKGIFNHIAMHNPDQVEVIDAPFVKMDPILEFIPDDRLRSILTSNSPALQEIRARMPPELIQRLQAKQNIPLSPINATFIPRKLHPYDTRGTSIISRMWRILMYEDAIFNASLHTARRAAAPIKVAKMGNAATGWIPPPEQEKKLLELLVQAEHDPMAWITTHYGVAFELVGAPERSMSINREWDMIERVKLVSLGISKAFLHGEVTYSSASTGLQVFLQRLKALRAMFETKWMYPKFFRPIAEMNGWVKPKPNEVMNRYRVKRSAQELQAENAYIMPKIVWDKSLDPQINTSLIQAMTSLEAMGVKFSKTTKMATVGYSFEEETKKMHREQEFEKTFLPQINKPDADGKKPGGGGGMPMSDDVPSSAKGGPGDLNGPGGKGPDGGTPPTGDVPVPPASLGDQGESQKGTTISHRSVKSPTTAQEQQAPDDHEPANEPTITINATKDNTTTFTKDELELATFILTANDHEQLAKAIKEADNEDNIFTTFKLSKDESIKSLQQRWALLDTFLCDNGYLDTDIQSLQDSLRTAGVIDDTVPPVSIAVDKASIKRLEAVLPTDEAMSDDDFVANVQRLLREQGKESKVLTDTFLTGV